MKNTQKMVLTPIEYESMPVLYPSSSSDVRYNSIPSNAQYSNVETQTSNVPSSNVQYVSTQTQTGKKPKSHPMLEKLINQLKIVLKLARVNAYDANFRITNENGIFIENSNIINLLQNVTTPAKALIGQDAFVTLLHKAGVEPDLISNENIKIKLIKLYETQSMPIIEKPPQIYSTISQIKEKASVI